MTLDQEFARYQGQSVLVPGQSEALRGQCFMWFDFVLHDVYTLPYFYAQGAIDIWNNPGWLLDHFDKISDGSIKKGDIVVFNQSVGSIYGHVDIAMQDGSIDSFLGSDSNWGGNKTVHLVNHIGRQYVLGSLRLKGSDMSAEDQQYAKIGRLFSDVKKLSEGVITMQATKTPTRVWDLDTYPNWQSHFSYNTGDKFDVIAYLDYVGNRYYISAPDLCNGKIWGVNGKDVKVISSKKVI